MNLDWQNVIVLTVVAGSALYLAKQAVGLLQRKQGGGCTSCSKCSADKLPDEKTSSGQSLVQLDVEPLNREECATPRR
jgi:hypothetical protein